LLKQSANRLVASEAARAVWAGRVRLMIIIRVDDDEWQGSWCVARKAPSRRGSLVRVSLALPADHPVRGWRGIWGQRQEPSRGEEEGK
jgi:hypothetical protein